MPDILMAPLGRRGAKILQQENPHSTRPTAMTAARLRTPDNLAERKLLSLADFTQGVPELGLETHARTPISSHDVAIDQPTCHALVTPSPRWKNPTNPTPVDRPVS